MKSLEDLPLDVVAEILKAAIAPEMQNDAGLKASAAAGSTLCLVSRAIQVSITRS